MKKNKQPMQTLEMAEQPLTILGNSLEYSIITLDLAGVILTCTQGAQRDFGQTEAEMKGSRMDRILEAGDDANSGHTMDALDKARKTGRWEGKLHRVRKNGDHSDVRAVIILRRSPYGQPLGFTVISRGIAHPQRMSWNAEAIQKSAISGRQHAQAELLRLANIIESSDDSIIGATPDGFIQSWNPASERLFDYSEDEIIGKHLSILCPPPLYNEQSRLITTVGNGENVQQHETILARKDGRQIEVSISLSQIKNAKGKPAGFSAIIRDITSKKKLEAKLIQSQKMEGLGQLAGGIAHDFNNLLTAIIGYSKFLLTQLPPADPKHDDALEILKAGERAAALTRQLLVFSRQQILDSKVLDINAVIADLTKMLHRIIGEHIDLIVRAKKDLGRVKMDPGQLEQVIVNLCVNAKDAMPEGGKLTIETDNVELGEDYVRTHPGDKAGLHVMLAISDDGSGMNAEVLSHLFEPFFTTKEQGKGTGLGLATIYGIVHHSGGGIDVHSELGHGTSFKIYLPQVDGHLLPPQTPAAPQAPCRGNEIILLVEDDDIVRKFAARVLVENGYTVLAACTPREAIQICERHKDSIHLLLTDIVMPQMFGNKLAKRLLSIKPQMKVIFMSGYTDQALIQRTIAMGAPFLQKPITSETVLRKIRDLLDQPDSCDPRVRQDVPDPGPN